MDALLPEEIGILRESFIRFMETEIVPAMPAHERAGTFPRDLIEKTGAGGFFGTVMPESLGGTDMGFLAAAVICEELARLDAGFAMCYNMQGMSCPYSIYVAGTDDQCAAYIPDIIAGKAIGMWSLTEPGGGSDAAGNMQSTARRDGDVYKLTGSKMFATFSNETDSGVLFARTDPAAGVRGITAFIAEPKKYPGWHADPIEFVGLSKALRSCAVSMSDFEVPVENRLGAEGDGFRIAMHAVQAGRIAVAGRGLGIARACIELAADYAKERMVRGSALATYQMVQADIADCVTLVEAARALTYQAAISMDRNLPSNRIASQAKYAAGLAVQQAAAKMSEIFGGYGLAEEYPISKLASYARLFNIGEGAPAVQRILIAEDFLGIKNADRHPTDYRNPRGDGG